MPAQKRKLTGRGGPGRGQGRTEITDRSMVRRIRGISLNDRESAQLDELAQRIGTDRSDAARRAIAHALSYRKDFDGEH